MSDSNVEVSWAEKVLDSRNCYHVNDHFNIVYCAYDDRQNCRSRFHAESPADLFNKVVSCEDSNMEVYIIAFVEQYDKVRNNKRAAEVRSAQLAANIRGDRDEDIRLFNEWVRLMND